MSRYLVVAHQTSTSPELRSRVEGIIAEDPGAEFTVLVPATPVQHMFTWEDSETWAVARARADEAGAMLEAAGANVTRTGIGARQPILAIADELREQPGYEAVIIGTLPPNISRWLKLDLVSQARKRFGLPVIHVVAEGRAAHEAPQAAGMAPGRPAAHVGMLVQLLRSDDGPTRRRAREGLTEVGRPAGPAVAELLDDDRDDIRWEAARTLVDLHDARAVPRLVDALEDRDPGVRWLAAEALITVGEPSLLPLLRRTLERPSSQWLLSGARHVCQSLAHGEYRQLLANVAEALDEGAQSVGWMTAVDRALRVLEGAEPVAAR